ncbi:MAG: hypothetical protein QOE11_65 [Solirubrobacteraceae bacterium]|jgi:hypothetical protein|nr:hypothetical protein [Solirubrobacteraceae bacterium]
MAYLNCGRCGLEIKIRAAFLRLENCPRCLARSAVVSPLVPSTEALTPASGWGPPAGRSSDPRDPQAPVPPAPAAP